MNGWAEAAEIQHDLNNAPGYLFDEAEKLTDDMAADLIKDADKLKRLDFDYEWSTNAYSHIARMMREIDGACKGRQDCLDALLTAVSNLQRDLLAKARLEVEADANDEVFAEEF